MSRKPESGYCNPGDGRIPEDPYVYAARLEAIRRVVREVDQQMGWRPREVRGRPGEIVEVVEVRR